MVWAKRLQRSIFVVRYPFNLHVRQINFYNIEFWAFGTHRAQQRLFAVELRGEHDTEFLVRPKIAARKVPRVG